MSRSFGIEIEHFITDAHGTSPNDAALLQLETALACHGYRSSKLLDEAPMDMQWAAGPLAARLHHDFYSHLIELSFAPTNEPDLFLSSYADAFLALRSSIQEVGLILHTSAVLPATPQGARFLFSKDPEIGKRYNILRQRHLPSKPFACRHYYSQAAATHVHIASDLKSDFSLLPYLYEMEYLVPYFFTNENHLFQKVRAIRPLWMTDSYSDTYWAAGFPIPFPVSLEEYLARLKRPEIVRDYSFIAPRPMLQTLEFRSADSLMSPKEILSLVLLRLVCLEIAQYRHVNNITVPDLLETHNHFRLVCLNGKPEAKRASIDIQAILERLPIFQSKWGGIASSLKELLLRGLTIN